MEKERKPSLFGPLFLIFLGVLFLLNNIGVVSWQIWPQLLRLWPIFLIGAGLDLLLGRRSMIGSVLVGVLMIALLAGALWFVSTQMPSISPSTQQVSYALEGAEQAEVNIDFSVGQLHVSALPESDNLLEGTLDLNQDEELQETYSVNGRATLTLGSRMPPMAFSSDWNQDRTWSIFINRDARLNLGIDTGAGYAKLDLRQLDIESLSVNSGVGQTTVIMPESGHITANVDGGVGQTIVEIPNDMEARIEVDRGLTNVRQPDSYRRSGDTYTSPGYDSADNRIDLQVSGGVGQIVIREYKGE
jgi:hypothetical protein